MPDIQIPIKLRPPKVSDFLAVSIVALATKQLHVGELWSVMRKEAETS
jgi:hypothetical protein